MREKIVLLCFIILFGNGLVLANSNTQNYFSVSNIDVSIVEYDVEVRFTARIGEKAIKGSDYSLVVTPVIENNGRRAELKPIMVMGRRAKISYKRNLLRTGNKYNPEPIMTANGKTVNYFASIPLSKWMEGGASFSIEGVLENCCKRNDVSMGVLLSDLFMPEPVNVILFHPEIDTLVVSRDAQERTLSTGEELSLKYPFVESIEQEEEAELDNRERSISIYFRQGGVKTESNYRDNSRSLDKLLVAIKELENSDEIEIAEIYISGFASPEGSKDINTRIAEQRAEAIKEYVMANSAIRGYQIKIHNGGADWTMLRKMVAESQMNERDEVLNIIDNTPVWDAKRNVGRLGELMRYNGGRTYKYMLKNFFPELRNATYIKIYYRDK